ncbi:hypothetical protein DM860_011329 [Cuscuta australis]|uniref:Pentacotripeptide-repeat region of PRORP domain-containing protein n=1 Tax=Cuscuta australis TaxID=267555 RepID=A0A328DU08_9ASTE|nr:hypothetical protein DM860_011329 [Cuscuta australis]
MHGVSRRLHCAVKAGHHTLFMCMMLNASPPLCKSLISHSVLFSSDSSIHGSNSPFSDVKFDFLEQFSPVPNTGGYNVITSNERRRILVGLSKMIKTENADYLNAFSNQFCPHCVVKIMKSFHDHKVAVPLFKYVFQDYSERMVQSGCIAALVLDAMKLRLMSQDMLSWIIRKIGESRGDEVVEFMCREYCFYASNYFSVLDSLMRAFLCSEMISGALRVLCIMREAGMQPSLSAVSILFKLLLRFDYHHSVWMLFRDMLHKGPCPNTYVYNVMILGFCKRGCLQIGESLLHLMRKFGCEQDTITYNILINAYCIKGWTSDALNWVHVMIEHGCKPNDITFGTIINALCKEGSIAEARRIFDEMQEFGVYASTETYNILMDGYVKAREVDKADSLYKEMIKNGISPDGITFNVLVAGYYKYRREENTDKLLRDLITREVIPDCSLTDVTIAGLCWAERLDEAVELLHTMLEMGIPLSVISFNSIIAAYSKLGLGENAFGIYNIMVKFGQNPSASTCASLLMCLCTTGRLHEAKELMRKMIAMDFPINRVSFTLLLDGYFKKGDTDSAHILWEEMGRIGMTPDVVAFSAFIDGLCKNGFVGEAYKKFLEMKRKELVPNNFVYNSLIAAFCKSGGLNEALMLEKEMREKGLIPDVFTINIILKGLCMQGRMQSAIDTYIKMQQSEVKPDTVTYNTLINGFIKAFDMASVDNLVSKMFATGWEPDITTYNIRLHGFCTSKKINRAVMMLNELVSAGIVPNTVTYNILMNGACNDVLDRAMILAAKLLKMAFIPNTVTANLLLSQLCKQGLPERAVMWGHKLSQIGIEFDEITYTILDRASTSYDKTRQYADYSKGMTEKSLFVDILMYITCDYLGRMRAHSDSTHYSVEFVHGSDGSLELVNRVSL